VKNKVIRHKGAGVIEPLLKGVLVFFGVAIILSTLAGFVWYRTHVNAVANQVFQLRKQEAQLALQRDNLQARVLQMENYARITRIAAEKLDLRPSPFRPHKIPVPADYFAGRP
jgi:cell division protein FtsL